MQHDSHRLGFRNLDQVTAYKSQTSRSSKGYVIPRLSQPVHHGHDYMRDSLLEGFSALMPMIKPWSFQTTDLELLAIIDIRGETSESLGI